MPTQDLEMHLLKGLRFSSQGSILEAGGAGDFRAPVLSGKEPTCQCRGLRDSGSVPGSRGSPGRGMATHSSIPAWRIPWTGEPGGLQSMGSHRVGQD